MANFQLAKWPSWCRVSRGSCSGPLEAQREPRGERAAEDVRDTTRRTAGPGESTKFARREPPTGPRFSDVDFAE